MKTKMAKMQDGGAKKKPVTKKSTPKPVTKKSTPKKEVNQFKPTKIEKAFYNVKDYTGDWLQSTKKSGSMDRTIDSLNTQDAYYGRKTSPKLQYKKAEKIVKPYLRQTGGTVKTVAKKATSKVGGISKAPKTAMPKAKMGGVMKRK